MIAIMNDLKQTPPPSSPVIDTSTNMADVTDTDERIGMTVNNSSQPSQIADDTPPTRQTISSEMEKRSDEVGSEPDNTDDTDTTIVPTTPTFDNPTVPTVAPVYQDTETTEVSGLDSSSPSVRGEQSVSGDMPNPASDDDTLANAQAMGFQLDEDSEHPKPLNMAGDFDRAEEEAHK